MLGKSQGVILLSKQASLEQIHCGIELGSTS